MAQNESDREDLMSEAVSLIRRIECRSTEDQVLTVVGFNEMGWLFVYRGSDPMYRFDEVGRMRRAYVNGLLFRTEGKTLAEMDRRREAISPSANSPKRTTLVRRDLSIEELDQFRERLHTDLRKVISDVRSGVKTRQVPEDAVGLSDEILAGLNGVLESKEFLAPAIVRRKR